MAVSAEHRGWLNKPGAGILAAVYNGTQPNTTAHGANTALDGVLIGTPVTPALAVDSMVIANAIASGDFLLALNRGGNSENYIFADGSAGTLTLYAPNGALTLAPTTDVVVGSGLGVLIGSTSQVTVSDGDGATNLIPELQALGVGTAFAGGAIVAATFNTTNTRVVSPKIILVKGAAATQVATTAVDDNEVVGSIIAYGSDSGDFETPVAAIEFVVDDAGGPGASAIGGSLEFYTTADGGTTLTKALTIDTAQNLVLPGDGRIDLSSCTTLAANTDGGVIKCGTASARVIEDTADMRFMNFNFDNGATSGDNRGMYLRLYLTGAGGGGEAARIFTTVEDVAGGTAHGAHISLNFGASGTLTGLGVAGRNTLHIPNTATQSGTLAAVQAEVWSDGSTSDPAGSSLSAIRVVNGGNATGMADVDDDCALIALDSGWTSATGNMLYTHAVTTPGAAAGSLKIRVNATDYYLYFWSAEGSS